MLDFSPRLRAIARAFWPTLAHALPFLSVCLFLYNALPRIGNRRHKSFGHVRRGTNHNHYVYVSRQAKDLRGDGTGGAADELEPQFT